jgi:hypothetical protein
MATGSPNNFLNKPYCNAYSATDPRFYFPSTPGDGSIMYYSNIYNKWTGSDVTRLSWNETSNVLTLYGNLVTQGTMGSYTTYVNGSTYTIEKGTTSFQIGSTGLVGVLGTGASLVLFAQSGVPTLNYYNLSTQSSTFKINYSGTNIADINSNGTTTLVPTKAQTTNQTTGTYYLPFVASSATQTLGQALNTSAGLSFNVATGTLTATNFSGLASSASTLSTTTAGAGTYYPLFSTSSLGGLSRTAYVDAGISYDEATATLSTTNFSGLASRASTIDTTTASLTTWYPTFVNAGTGGTSKVLNVDTGITFNNSTDTLACTNFSGLSSRSSTIDTTTASLTTWYPTFVNAGTGGTSKVLNVDTGITFNNSTDTLTCTNFSGLASRSSTIDTTTQPASTTYYLALTNANTGGTSKVLYTGAPSYNSGTSTLTATNFAGTASVATRATLVDTTGYTHDQYYYVPFVLNQTGTSQILRTDGNPSYTLNYNPAFGYLTSSAFQINDQTMTSKYWRLENIPANPSTMLFNNSWTGGHYPLQLDGTAGVASTQTNNLFCDGNTPDTYAELDTPILSASSSPSGGSYTSELLYMSTTTNGYTAFGTRGLNTGTGAGGSATCTLLVNGHNPMGRTIKTDLCMGVKMYASSAVNRTFTYNFNSLTLTMTRNGSSFSNFYLNHGLTFPITRTYTITATSTTVFNLFDPLVNLDIYFEPNDSGTNDTYVMTVAYTYTISIAPAGGVFQEQIGNPAYAFMGLDCPAQSSTRLSGTGTFTFNQAQRVSPQTYAITKSLSTNNQTGYLENIHIENNVNLVYNGFFSTSTSVTFPYCFAGGFYNYKIYLHITISTSYNLITFNLVDKNGTVKTTGYNGSIVQLGSTYTYTAWAGTGIPVTYTGQYSNGNDVIEFDICNPNNSRSKMYKGYNYGSNTGNMTIVSSGGSIDSTLYPSLRLTPSPDSIQGYITIVGYNSRI